MRSLISLICLSLLLHGCGGGSAVFIGFEWGSCDFDRDRWAYADRFERGCMMSSFLDSYYFVGMPVVEVALLLGEPFTHVDHAHPAYLVAQRAPGGSLGREQLLVFFIDRITGRVVEVQLRPLA